MNKFTTGCMQTILGGVMLLTLSGCGSKDPEVTNVKAGGSYMMNLKTLSIIPQTDPIQQGYVKLDNNVVSELAKEPKDRNEAILITKSSVTVKGVVSDTPIVE